MSDPITDRFAIQDLMTRYVSVAHSGNLVDYEQIFLADVVVTGYAPETIEGRDAYIEATRKALRPFSAVQPIVSNFLVDQDGDAATVRCYVQVTGALARPPKRAFTLWGRYEDDVVRRDDRWWIQVHRFLPTHSEVRAID